MAGHIGMAVGSSFRGHIWEGDTLGVIGLQLIFTGLRQDKLPQSRNWQAFYLKSQKVNSFSRLCNPLHLLDPCGAKAAVDNK